MIIINNNTYFKSQFGDSHRPVKRILAYKCRYDHAIMTIIIARGIRDYLYYYYDNKKTRCCVLDYYFTLKSTRHDYNGNRTASYMVYLFYISVYSSADSTQIVIVICDYKKRAHVLYARNSKNSDQQTERL